MSHDLNQNKKMTACLSTAIKAIFLFAILFAVCLNNNYAQDIWTQKKNFGGTARYAAAGFSVGGKGYIGTGYDGSDRKDFWEFDPATNAWTQKADFGGAARSFAIGFSISSKGYIGTGSNRGLTDYYKDFWEYDPSTNAWTQKANFGGAARVLVVGFSIGSKGYIGTGWTNGVIYKDFWEYDPSTNTWTQKADVGGTERYAAVGFSIGGKGYLGTGSNPDQSVYYKDFWEYDPATNSWTQKANYLGAVPTAEVGFAIGTKGYVGTGQDHGIGTKEFWEYDPASDAWKQKADFGGAARWHAVGFSIGSKGYIGTGQGPTKDFWEYTPDTGCPAPANLRVKNISDTSAVLKWENAGAEILHVRVRYRAVGGTTWTIKNKNGAYPSVHTDRLTPNTTYQWQARSFCAADTTGWVTGPDFTTAASLNPGIKATAYPNPTMNTVTVNYSTTKSGKYIFEITNASGNVVLRKEANAILGANHITLDISRFFKGVYFISIIRPDMTRERIQLNKE